MFNDPPDPPPVVPMIGESAAAAGLSVKQQHLENSACFDWHQKFDPWGLSFEQYDAVGQWRKTFGEEMLRKPVDASISLPDSVKVQGLRDMQKHLVKTRAKSSHAPLSRRC